MHITQDLCSWSNLTFTVDGSARLLDASDRFLSVAIEVSAKTKEGQHVEPHTITWFLGTGSTDDMPERFVEMLEGLAAKIRSITLGFRKEDADAVVARFDGNLTSVDSGLTE